METIGKRPQRSSHRRGHPVRVEVEPFPGEAVAAALVELGRGRVERDRDLLRVARPLGGLEDGSDRLLARGQVGREAALVADRRWRGRARAGAP